MTSRELVQAYLNSNYHIVTWPPIGDIKGPRDPGWPQKNYTLDDYQEGYRVGILTGTEVSPGKFLHDVDIDWGEGSKIAQAILPSTSFIFGRQSKHVSHCFYTTSEPIPSYRYNDIDGKSCLIELRGTKVNGEIGMQTMVPPSVWSKDQLQEPLSFVKTDGPTHVESATDLKQKVCLAAIGMIIARHLGPQCFGHEARLAWAGFLLRAGISAQDLVIMGQAIAVYCESRDLKDIEQVVFSTASALLKGDKKIKGAPTLAKLIGAKGSSVIDQVNNWLGRDSDYARTSDGTIIRDHQKNIQFALQTLHVEISHQSFSEQLLISENGSKATLLDDYKMNHVWLRIDKECQFRPTPSFYEKMIKDLAWSNSFHPVRDYLSGLVWDQQSRINQWLSVYGGVEETMSDSYEKRTYLEAVSAIVLIAAVRRIFQPGCKYDEMLVLESEQGMNKSSALRALAVRDEWFSDDLPLNVDTQQVIERTLGKWIIEASDLVGGRKADRDHLKSMLSRQIDGPARMAYAHNPVERPRQFIIIGTTNSASYLADMTGARRFWPVKVKKFDVEGIIRNRDQIWAEAMVREASGESIRLPEELYDEASAHQEVRREVDAWEEAIKEEVLVLEPNNKQRIQIAADAIWRAVGNTDMSKRDRAGARRISEIMQRFGFERTNIYVEKKVVTGYIKTLSPVELKQWGQYNREETLKPLM